MTEFAEAASVPESTPTPPEGPFHQAFQTTPGDPLVWHTGEFQECVPCLVAAGLREPEEPAPAPAPRHTHNSAAQALVQLQGLGWQTMVHPQLSQLFRTQIDWSGPVPKFTVLIVPADGRELDSSSIQELSWDMLAIDPAQVSGQGAE